MSVVDFLKSVSLWPRARRSDWVGVRIGSSAVTLAEVERSGDSYHLTRSAIVPLAPLGEKGPKNERGWLSRDLRRHLAASNPFAGKTAACVLSMSMTGLQTMDIPRGTPAEQREIIAQEFTGGDEPVPLPAFDFWPAPRTGKDDLESVYVLSLDEQLAISVGDELLAAGMQLSVIDGLPFALARGIQMAAPNRAHVPAAALDWCHSTATFVVAVDGQPVFTRLLKDCGTGQLTKALGTAFQLSGEDTRRLMSEVGVPDPSKTKASDELATAVLQSSAEFLDRLVDELSKTLSFLHSKATEMVPASLWLFGGGGTIAHIGPYLSSAIGIPAQPWTLPATATPAASLPLYGVPAALSSLGCPA